MDDIEEGIHKILNITSYKTLKEEGFYKKNSPLSNFHAEYQNQYLQYTAYLKLYYAFKHLDYIKNDIESNFDFRVYTERVQIINSFINNIFSVCDILAKQIYILLTDSVEWTNNVYLHKISKKKDIKKLEKNINKPIRWYLRLLNKFRKQVNMNNDIKINYDRYDNYYRKILQPISLKDSWYNELKYYRNTISHGILILTHWSSKAADTRLLKKDIYENKDEFEFVVRNLPVHNKNPTEQIIDDLKDKFNDITIYEQFTNYFDNVKKLASDVWEKMHELYTEEGLKADWKL